MDRLRSSLLFFCLFNLFFSCSSCFAGPQVLVKDNFKSRSDLKEFYLEGTQGGSYSVSDGKLTIEMNKEGRYGVYHTKPISGHFLVETDFAEEENIALALIQEKDGKPDIQNYTLITMDKDNGVAVVAVKDCQNGKKDVLDNTGKFFERRNRPTRERIKNDDYKHVLNGEMYSVRFTETTKQLRIFRDSGPGFFHYYYGVKQTIRGQEASGWMELLPSRDWANKGQKYYVALIAMGKGKAVFNNVSALQKPTEDKDDRQTGFSINHREYNWSGYFGDAVVVAFGDEFPFRDKDYKFASWSEASYIPGWHLSNQFSYTYEFVETWEGGNPGCHEPMSDRIQRWASAEIIENSAVRKRFKWCYVLCNPDYKVPDDNKGVQLPEVEEYYTFYPDGSGIRHIVYIPKLDTNYRYRHELGELISNAGSQTYSEPFYDSPALTLTNLEGDYEKAHPGIKMDYGSHIDDWDQVIMSVHLKDFPDVFAVWSTDPAVPDTYSGYPIRYEIAWQGIDGHHSHWPVNKRPYTGDNGSTAIWRDAEVSHTCLLSWGVLQGIDWEDNYKRREDGRKYRQWVSLVGLNEKGDLEGIRNKARSWLFPGDVIMLNDTCRFIKNDVAKKALVFEIIQNQMKCHFEIDPKDSILINPAIEIKGWKMQPGIRVMLDNKVLSKKQYKYEQCNNQLMLWIQTTGNNKTSILIEGLCD